MSQLKSQALFFMLFLFTAAMNQSSAETCSALEQALQSENTKISRVMSNPAPHELQILFTHRHADAWVKHRFQIESDSYFYPASTVKFPAAISALRWLEKQQDITLDTPYQLAGNQEWFTLREDIRQIFAISDDDAYNRLYEILGRDYINHDLRQLGLAHTRIAHRLGTKAAAKSRRNPVYFKTATGRFDLSGKDSQLSVLSIDRLNKGVAYLENKLRIDQAMDFSKKNYFPLEEQVTLLTLVVAKKADIGIGKENLGFLQDAMHQTPAVAGYKADEYFNGYANSFFTVIQRQPSQVILESITK